MRKPVQILKKTMIIRIRGKWPRSANTTHPALISFSSMSDKVREFAEIPQQFIRDGNQVRLYVLFCALANVLLLVSYPLYKTLAKRCIALKS